MTDDEAIVFAALAGCEFHDNGAGTIYADGVEHCNGPFGNFEADRRRRRLDIGFDSQIELAHAFCKFYKLGDYADDQRQPAR